MAETARALNPGIEIVVRSHSEEESALLRADGIGTVVVRDEALAQSMARHVLERVAPAPATAPAALHRGVQH
jgi:CPA2 family monovalent cation:H+ antiporter-2